MAGIREIFQQPLLSARQSFLPDTTLKRQPSDAALFVGAKTPFQVLGDIASKGRDFIGRATSPVQTREQIEQERKQTVLPSVLKNIQTQQAKRAGAIKVGDGYVSVDPFGAAGSARKVTAKTLERISSEIKAPTVARNTIEQMLQRPDVRQAEKNVIKETLDEIRGAAVPVKEFLNRVDTKLLPLEGKIRPVTSYENISLSDDLRGPVSSYTERIYESPIRTSAGGVHFGTRGRTGDAGTDNYFAHTRIEDLPSKGALRAGENQRVRRVIELQSDLFQKGMLESSVDELPGESMFANMNPVVKAEKEANLSKLEPYRNTWWERIIREEVRMAAINHKTKLQFPTGETAMKIEGLGETSNWTIARGANRTNFQPLGVEDLKVGEQITQGGMIHMGVERNWIITNVLGEGKFKAVPKGAVYGKGDNFEWNKKLPDGGKYLDSMTETFDISGKVDTNNPIYRFYEKDVARYLKNRYGAKVVTDPQGVTWLELGVPKEAGKLPVEAFGAGLVPVAAEQRENKKELSFLHR